MNSVLALLKDWGPVRAYFFCPYHNRVKTFVKSHLNCKGMFLSEDTDVFVHIYKQTNILSF